MKEERRIELEKIGLKWAVLSTTSWQSMYEALCKYVEARKSNDKNNHWDGHVPANYETNEKPPKRLGRWVTRQRAAYSSKKLKNDYREKLEKLGLSWEPNDNKSMNHSNLAHHALQQKRQQDKKLSNSTGNSNSASTAPPVVVVQRPLLQTAPIRHVKPNVPMVSTVKANDVPLVASLKPPTTAVPPVSSIKSQVVIKKQSSHPVNNK